MNERIKKVRRMLDLTQQEFAERIGVKRNTVATYEMGRSEPSNAAVSLICKTFNVNEDWLRTGKGEMFAPKASNALEALAKERGLSHGAYIAIEKFLNLKPEMQEGIIDYFLEVATALNGDDVPASAPAFPGVTEEDLHAELDRQIAEEKGTAAKSEVS